MPVIFICFSLLAKWVHWLINEQAYLSTYSWCWTSFVAGWGRRLKKNFLRGREDQEYWAELPERRIRIWPSKWTRWPHGWPGSRLWEPCHLCTWWRPHLVWWPQRPSRAWPEAATDSARLKGAQCGLAFRRRDVTSRQTDSLATAKCSNARLNSNFSGAHLRLVLGLYRGQKR